MVKTVNRFSHLLENTSEFVVTCEHIPGLASRGKKLDEIVAFAGKSAEGGLVHALSLTDNPGGTPALSPDVLAREIEAAGLPTIVHVTAKDMNRSMIESRLLALDRMGVHNVLVMSGDYPTDGQAGLSMPVFDVDPIHILTMISLMNCGKRIDYGKRSLSDGPSTSFFHGSVVSPYKFTEAGQMLQYYKMEKKVRAGTRYFVTQLGFDARKLRDLKTYMDSRNIDIPVIGSVFILRCGAARVMHAGDIPGSFVTDELLADVTAESKAEDKGRAASLERAAMQVAVMMGLGFRGAHIEAMILRYDMVETIVSRAKELAPQWEECEEKLNYAPSGAFYLSEGKGNVSSSASEKLRRAWPVYLGMRALHSLFFVKDGSLSPLMRTVSRLLESWKITGALSHYMERGVKRILFDCRDCGDCALPELEYLCPQSQCPKQERNAPCGGSRLDACEVYPEKPCVWNRVYIRAKAYDELDMLRDTIIGPRDWKLQYTSAWVNYHLDRDHASYDFAGIIERDEENHDQASSSSPS